MSFLRRILVATALAGGFASAFAFTAQAQGVTTGAITGSITDPSGAPLNDVQVQIANPRTGASAGAVTRNGRYFVQGLEPGSGYVVRARLLGYAPQERTGVTVGLSQTTRIDFQLATAAVQLGAVTTTAATRTEEFGPSRQGAQTVVSDTAIARLPNIDRQLGDLVRLTPQVVSNEGRISAAGQNNRFTAVQIDGVVVANRFGLGDNTELGGQVSGGRSMSMEAVKEYQVALSPFDVRQGNFTGALLNAVTKRGTNEFSGSAFAYHRQEEFARNDPFIRARDFRQTQFGGSLGGPIVRDRLHFFGTVELNREATPASGPYLGQPANAPIQLRTDSATINAFSTRLRALGLADPGSAGQVTNENPLLNTFIRFDYQINDRNRLVVRNIYNDQREDEFSRNLTNFALSSRSFVRTEKSNSAVAQLYSNFANGAANEAIIGFTRVRFDRVTPQRFPQILLQNVGGQGNLTLQAGTENSSQGNSIAENMVELTNNFTMPLGAAHRLTIGTRNEIYKAANTFFQNSFGSYAWQGGAVPASGTTPASSSLDDFLAGRNPTTLNVSGRIDPTVDPRARFTAIQASAYVQDQWTVSPRLTVNLGLRADAPFFPDSPPYTAIVDSVFNPDPTAPIEFNRRQFNDRTDRVPSGNWQVSPRIGFNWDVTGDQRNQFRGGVGLFQGQPAYVWMSNQYQNNGRGLGQISCGGGNAANFGTAPAFNPNPDNQPRGCGPRTNGQPGVVLGQTTVGAINIASPDLKFPQVARGTVGFDRALPFNLIGTVEGLYTRGLNNLVYINRNLTEQATRGTDGRVLYGVINQTTGLATPANITTRATDVIEVRNQNKDYSYSATAQLRKPYSNNWEGSVAYTYGRSYSVSDLTSSVAFSNWQFGRTLATSQLQFDATPSVFDAPHRVIAAGSYTLPFSERFGTSISGIYQFQSGGTMTYTYGGNSGFGDFNADGSNANDPIYIPRNAFDANEIQFRDFTVNAVRYTAQQQQQAFENFIAGDECLSSQRGKIMGRGSCRNPSYATFDVTVRQELPALSGQRVALEVQIFNFLNFLNEDWGKVRRRADTRNANSTLLQHRAMATGANGAVPVFEFNPILVQDRFVTRQSAFDFYRMQFGLRYSF